MHLKKAYPQQKYPSCGKIRPNVNSDHPGFLTRSPQDVFPEDIQCVFNDAKNGGGSIFLGNLEAAENVQTLKKHGIKALLTACKNVHIKHSKDHIPYYLYIPGEDHENYDLSLHFETAINFIRNSLKSGNILVHCMAGVSRSVSLVLAYLMKHENMSFHQAFRSVRERRKIINPNKGFVKQLIQLEHQLQRERLKRPQKHNQLNENTMKMNTTLYETRCRAESDSKYQNLYHQKNHPQTAYAQYKHNYQNMGLIEHHNQNTNPSSFFNDNICIKDQIKSKMMHHNPENQQNTRSSAFFASNTNHHNQFNANQPIYTSLKNSMRRPVTHNPPENAKNEEYKSTTNYQHIKDKYASLLNDELNNISSKDKKNKDRYTIASYAEKVAQQDHLNKSALVTATSQNVDAHKPKAQLHAQDDLGKYKYQPKYHQYHHQTQDGNYAILSQELDQKILKIRQKYHDCTTDLTRKKQQLQKSAPSSEFAENKNPCSTYLHNQHFLEEYHNTQDTKKSIGEKISNSSKKQLEESQQQLNLRNSKLFESKQHAMERQMKNSLYYYPSKNSKLLSGSYFNY